MSSIRMWWTMRASELIQALQDLVQEYGDGDMAIATDCIGGVMVDDVEELVWLGGEYLVKG